MGNCYTCRHAGLVAVIPLSLVIIPLALFGSFSIPVSKGHGQPFPTVPPLQVTFESPFTQEPAPASTFGNLAVSQDSSLTSGSSIKTTAAAFAAVSAAWAGGLGAFALWRRRGAKLSKLVASQASPKPCDRGQLVAGAGLIVSVDLFLGLPAAYVVIAGGGVTPAAIAAEVFETLVVLPLNLVGLYLMGESGCIQVGQPAD